MLGRLMLGQLMLGSEMAIDIANQNVADRAAGQPARKTKSGKELIYRHSLFVRLAHWVNVLCIALLLMSGLQIFNAHPMLHWGIKGGDTDPAVLSIYAEEQVDVSALGWTKIGGSAFNPTGVLGVFRDRDGFLSGRAFPWWITIPSSQNLAEGRRWHRSEEHTSELQSP